MTSPPCVRSGLLALLAALLLGQGLTARAEPPAAPPPAPLPEHLVARIYDAQGGVVAEMTAEGLALALAQAYVKDLAEVTSAALTILRELIEGQLVEQEARRLSLVVSAGDVADEERRLDTRLRLAAGGQSNLAELRRGKGMSAEDFRGWLRVELLKAAVAGHPSWLGKLPDNEKQRMSQISVVVVELHKRAQLVWRVPNGLGSPVVPAPAGASDGALVLVNGVAITWAEFGRALLRRLPEDEIKDVLEREAATQALKSENVHLDDAGMQAELEYRGQLWLAQRSLMGDDRWRTLPFEQYLEGVLKMDRRSLAESRYHRSFYGLVRRLREQVTEAEVLAEFERKQDTHYGPAVVVHGLQVSFVRKTNVFGGGGGREKRDALLIVQEALRESAAGRPFSDVVRNLVGRYRDPRNPSLPDPTVREGRRRLFNVSADKILYDAALLLHDGETSGVVETLSELYVMRRESLEPARPLADVRDVVREALAGGRARARLEEIVQDPRRVQIRWPLRARD